MISWITMFKSASHHPVIGSLGNYFYWTYTQLNLHRLQSAYATIYDGSDKLIQNIKHDVLEEREMKSNISISLGFLTLRSSK